jgi:hypothetical protein
MQCEAALPSSRPKQPELPSSWCKPYGSTAEGEQGHAPETGENSAARDARMLKPAEDCSRSERLRRRLVAPATIRTRNPWTSPFHRCAYSLAPRRVEPARAERSPRRAASNGFEVKTRIRESQTAAQRAATHVEFGRRAKHQLARPARFERATLGLEVRCSIQLSYERERPSQGAATTMRGCNRTLRACKTQAKR